MSQPKPPEGPRVCAACGQELVVKQGQRRHPWTGLPSKQGPEGRWYHDACRPPERLVACYVCHQEGPQDQDRLEQLDWVCQNCGNEYVTFSWGRKR
jgi:ssDNA-binding Zn-finger/Zn-ribbon topoisomerase 1